MKKKPIPHLFWSATEKHPVSCVLKNAQGILERETPRDRWKGETTHSKAVQANKMGMFCLKKEMDGAKRFAPKSEEWELLKVPQMSDNILRAIIDLAQETLCEPIMLRRERKHRTCSAEKCVLNSIIHGLLPLFAVTFVNKNDTY